MRFRPPARDEVDAAVFDHPVFAGCVPWRDWLSAAAWPSLEAMNRAWPEHPEHRAAYPFDSMPRARFVAQTPALLGDGLHYEQRIAQRGEIATRAESWHDLLNALIWLRFPGMKWALNARQVADITRVGTRQRTRAQDALTQFDEAGVIVSVGVGEHCEAIVRAWDAHAWSGLFGLLAHAPWRIDVIGHALLEHALYPDRLLVGKAILILDERCDRDSHALHTVTSGIAHGTMLCDPQELRPLPLMGLPGWHPRSGEASFYAEAECFQPVRPGRRYPQAVRVAASSAFAGPSRVG